ncbi:ultra-long-chain fatty acid omega-hydroxylase-like [Dysidea avara]|uniref:ultra-long-chain fatty acid omega-hydroxylase-like n=1 Tax=Dysidea avara TaxID=196820 RepID=UPI00332F8D39
MDVTYSLFAGALVTLLLLVLTRLSFIIRKVHVGVTWCADIKYLRSLPSPPKRWIFGHALELGPTESSIRFYQKCHKEFPKYCVYWIGPIVAEVRTADVETMRRLMLQPENPKPPAYGFLHKWIGDGLLTTSGAKWRRHRKMLTPAFHFDILKQYIPVYNEVSHKLVEVWSGLADSGESVEITEYLHSYTLDVLLRCMYSSNSNCLEKKDGMDYLKAVKQLTDLFMARVYPSNPLHLIDWIYFNTTAGHQFLHYSDVVHKFSEGVIVQRREELLKTSKPAKKYVDFLDILLSAKDENGEGLTDTEIREEVDTFMFEGHDTTASGLSWVLYCLAMYKQHQEMCRKEIREVLAGRDYITWENLSKLSYTTMCIKESLRLYPPVPYIAKELSEEIILDGQRIPKGTWIALGIITMHHDPLVWDNAEEFDPTRFNAENSKKRDPFAYLPFSAGPRNCIGQHFAMDEIRVTVAHILNKFHLEVDKKHNVERYAVAILSARTGIKVKLSLV